MTPDVIKVIGVCAIFLIAIIGALVVFMLEHQRKMTRILRGEQVDESGDTLAALMGSISGDSAKIKALEARIEQLEQMALLNRGISLEDRAAD